MQVTEVTPVPPSDPPRRTAAASSPWPAGSQLAAWLQQDPADFQIEMYERLLARLPEWVEVLEALAELYRRRQRHRDGLAIDLKLTLLRPRDPRAHYNLACRYALLRQPEQALRVLRKAIELGYRDFRFMEQDEDLRPLRQDPRFRKLLEEFRKRPRT